MDHSHHDMPGHDMPSHDMPGHDMPGHNMPMCSMNMLFTWNTENLCIVFKQWRITGTLSLLISILAIMALCAGYELVRDLARRYENSVESKQDPPNESSSLIPGRSTPMSTKNDRQVHMIKAAFYATQVFYSFFIMLLFMTYNGWIMLAVAAGSFVGYLIWGGGSATKAAACH